MTVDRRTQAPPTSVVTLIPQILALVLALLALSREINVNRGRFASSTFSYNPNTAGEEKLARALHSELGSILKPSTGSEQPVFKYGRNGELIGAPAVNAVLPAIAAGSTPAHLGRLAIFASIALLVLAFNLRESSAKFASIYPLIGLVLATGLTSACATCAPGAGAATYAPIATILYFAWGGALFTVPILRQQGVFLAYGVISAVIPIVQALLLVNEPKLCPICLATTFLSALLMHSAVEAVRRGSSVSILLPSIVRGGVAMGSVALIGLHFSLLTGALRSTPSSSPKLGSLVGTQASALIRHTNASSLSGRLLMLTAPGCGACSLAKAELPSSGLHALDVPPCGALSTEACFESGQRAVMTPTFLVCDRNGEIVTQYVGWPSSPFDLETFVRQMDQSVRSLQ